MTLSQLNRSSAAAEVPVCDMTDAPLRLYDKDGCAYKEVDTNIWMKADEPSDAAYVGTSKHGGGVVLRLMFVKDDGRWVNVITGRELLR